MKTLAQGFNTATQDSNPGSRSRESKDLLLSHSALHFLNVITMNLNISADDCRANGMAYIIRRTTMDISACTFFCHLYI